jgi:predicted porin
MTIARVLAGTVLGMASLSALAQSNVTVFGVMDVGIGQIKNKDRLGNSVSITQERSDGISSSRLGFRGVEDLGGGLNASFWLEAPIIPDTGSANATKFWNRRSTVSLSSTAAGELRLGRDYAPAFQNLANYDTFGTNGVGSGFNLVSVLGSGATTAVRVDNTLGYWLPAGLGGVYGQVMLAAGENATSGTQANNKLAGFRVGYSGFGVDAGAAYNEATIVATDSKFKTTSLGGSYAFAEGAKLQATWQRNAYQSLRQDLWLIGGAVNFGQATIRASVGRSTQSGRTAAGVSTDDDKATLVAAGGIYALSKRTAVYGTLARIKNDGNAAFTIGGSGSTAGGSSTAIEMGLRHAF